MTFSKCIKQFSDYLIRFPQHDNNNNNLEILLTKAFVESIGASTTRSS